MTAITTAELPMYQRVAGTLSDIPGLVICKTDEGITVEFYGARLPRHAITTKITARRERALHALLYHRFKVRAAIAPTCASKLYLLVVGVKAS